MSARRFTFEGFLPQDKKEQKQVLERLKDTTVTTIFYEAPHRIIKTLELMKQYVDGPVFEANDNGDVDENNPKKRSLVICKELTKKHEWSMQFDSVESALAYFRKDEPKGEFVIVIEGCDEEELKAKEIAAWSKLSIEEHMDVYLSQGMDKKEAMKAVAKDRGVSKRDVYQALLAD